MTVLATDTFTGTNGAAWNAQWATSGGNGGTATFTIQSNAGQWSVSTTGTYSQAYLTGMTATTDCDFFCDFKASTNSVQNFMFFGVSVPTAAYLSTDPFFPNVGYGVQVTVATTAASSAMQIFKNNSGFTAEGSPVTITVTAGTWYTMYVKRRAGVISAYFYAQGGAIPGTPQCTFTDGSPLGSGKCVVTGSPQSTTFATQAIDNVQVTDGVAGDTTAPTVPSGVTATATSSSSVTISWTASTDAVGVASYRIQRGGVDLTGATALTGTSFVDSTVSASTTYSYTVSAVDAAGNRSAESTAATATTPSGSLNLFKLGSAAIDAMHVGTGTVSTVYLGTNQIWP